MFDDIIQNRPEEKSSLPKCIHIYDNEKCTYYIPDKNDKRCSQSCEFFGELSESCYLDKFDF